MLLALSAAFGCEDPPGDGTLVVALEIADPTGTVLDGLEAATMVIDRVDIVHRSDPADAATEALLTVMDEPLSLTIDDLGLGGKEVIGTFFVPTGAVFQIRLVLDDLVLTIAGEDVDTFTPSAERTGLKLAPSEAPPQNGDPFPIEEGEITAVLGLFNHSERVVVNRGRGTIVKPVIPAIEVDPETLGFPADPFTMLVRFEDTATSGEISTILSDFGLTVVRVHRTKPLYTVNVPDPNDVVDLHDRLEEEPAVRFVTPNFGFKLRGLTTCPAGSDPGCNLEFWLLPANAFNAWALTTVPSPTSGGNTRLAIIDNGFDLDHPDLIANYAINQGEIPATVVTNLQAGAGDVNGNGLWDFVDLNAPGNAALVICPVGTPPANAVSLGCCPADANPNPAFPNDLCDSLDLVDGNCPGNCCVAGYGWQDSNDDDNNGYCDDLVGWDFSDDDNMPEPSALDLRLLLDGTVWNHGTAVAGFAAAFNPNAVGLVGIEWFGQIVPLRSANYFTGSRREFVLDMAADVTIEALDYVADPLNQIRAANASWGLSMARRGFGRRGCDATFKFRRSKYRELVAEIVEAWIDVDFGRFLFVSAVENCDIDMDVDRDDFIDWPTHFNTNVLSFPSGLGAHIRVTSYDQSNQVTEAFGPNSVDMAARGDLTADGMTIYPLLAYTSGPAMAPPQCPPTGFGGTVICGDAAVGRPVGELMRATSFATPQVLGTAGLVDTNNPGLTPRGLRDFILNGANPSLPPTDVRSGRALDVCGAIFGMAGAPGC